MPQAFSKKMQTKLSTWTPLNHPVSNAHIFEERRNLLVKWFEKWSDGQKTQVLHDLVSRCSISQLKHLRQILSSRVLEDALDFTRVFPRVMSLYIFSFLDPRSLSRCSQVSWHWKSLAELDQLWMPKCLKLGWCITFSPSLFEQGVWKRHYIETVRELHIGRPKGPVKQCFIIPEVKVLDTDGSLPVPAPRDPGKDPHEPMKPAQGLPPWRDADPRPTDTIRFNYLDNLDPIEHARETLLKKKSLERSMKAATCSTYKLRKVKSLMFLSLGVSAGKFRDTRPAWASQRSNAPPAHTDSTKRLSTSSQWDAGIRPGPVSPPVPRLSKEGLRASQRSHRSSPTMALFEEKP